jgi:hypothetical protein
MLLLVGNPSLLIHVASRRVVTGLPAASNQIVAWIFKGKVVNALLVRTL